MKLHIQNLGPIKEATIDLSKRFYTFVGYNNSGKTYLANLLWCVFSRIDYSFFKDFIERNKNNYYFQNETSVIKQELLDKLPNEYALYIQNEMLPKVLNIEKNSPIIKYLQISFDSIDTSIKNAIEIYPIKYHILSYTDEEIIIGGRGISDFLDILCIHLFRLFYTGNEISFLPTERLSFMTFYKYFFRIEQERREEIEKHIRKIDKNNPNWKALEEVSESGYVQTHQNLLEEIYSTDSKFIKNRESYKNFKINEHIIQQLEIIMGGKLNVIEGAVNGNANFYFQMQKTQELLKLHTTSSSVNQLSTLYLYWKYWAEDDDNFLIIDEPEQNLHPENQTKLTELLIQFANRNNNRVLICTHSPLIAEVINNYLVLGQLDDKEAAQKSLGLAENCFLTPENTGIYFFTGENVREYKISDYGTIFEDFKAAQEKVWDVGGQLGELMYHQINKKIQHENTASQ